MTKSRLNKAFDIKDNALKVNDNTYVIPSQTREGKAHIVSIAYELICPSVPNNLLIRAKYLFENRGCLFGTSAADIFDLLNKLGEYVSDDIPTKTYKCTCEDYKYHPHAYCKHILAVQLKYRE